jgi:hypothetical protein
MGKWEGDLKIAALVLLSSLLLLSRSRPTSDLGAVSFRNCPPGSASIRDIAY